MTNPDINIHLLNLVKQYKSDVKTRISILKGELNDIRPDVAAAYTGDMIIDVRDGIKEQLSHWQITLLQINEVLKECER
jgi:hypothetical protein